MGDPACQNGNHGPRETNTQNDPLGYDMGIAQLKLRYLVGSVQNVTDASDAGVCVAAVSVRAITFIQKLT